MFHTDQLNPFNLMFLLSCPIITNQGDKSVTNPACVEERCMAHIHAL